VDEELQIGKVDVTATLACVGALCFWSLGPIFIKYLTGYIDSWTQNLLRYSVACVFWLPFLALSARRKRLDARIWRRAALPAAANIVMQSLWSAAFYYLNPAFMVLLTKTTIIWIAGFSLIFFREERALVKSRRFWAGLGLCVIGVAGVLGFKEDFAARGTITGVAIGLATAFMWGVYTVSVRMAFRDTDSAHSFSVISIYTVAGLCVFAVAFGNLGECLSMGAKQWAVVVVSAVLCISLGHVLYYAAMRRVGATIPALVILAQPFSVFAISYICFGETLTILQLVFGAALLVGAGLAIWSQQHLNLVRDPEKNPNIEIRNPKQIRNSNDKNK